MGIPILSDYNYIQRIPEPSSETKILFLRWLLFVPMGGIFVTLSDYRVRRSGAKRQGLQARKAASAASPSPEERGLG